MRALPLFAVCAIALADAFPASDTPNTLPDLISWSLGYKSRKDEGLPRQCVCETPFCQCCVDFNMSYVDLGGPGCVRLKYISQEEGFSVNVTYGENQLHSAAIKGTEPALTCMNLLSEIAQICARFSDMTRTSDGLKTCTYLEPTLLGDKQESYPIGCFLMNSEGISLLPNNNTSSTSEEEDNQGDSTDYSEESFIAAVNESAEEGISWFSSLLGLNFGNSPASSSNDTSKIEESTPAT